MAASNEPEQSPTDPPSAESPRDHSPYWQLLGIEPVEVDQVHPAASLDEEIFTL